MNRNHLSMFGVFVGIVALNIIFSLQFEQKEAFAAALIKLKNERREISRLSSETTAPNNSSEPVVASSKITFNDLREYRFNRRAAAPIPGKLKALQGKEVNIAGYMIPMSEALDVTEFMLVQMPFFGCCYSVPPEPNETVMVKFPKGKSTPYVYTPIRVTGKFKIQETKIDDFIVSVYEIEAADVKEAAPNDKDVIQHQAGTPAPNGY